MKHTKKIVLGLLVSSFSFQAFPMEQEAVPAVEVTQEEIVTEPAQAGETSFAIRSIDYVTNKLGHIKKCLQGKEVCSKTDFAVLGASFVFLKSLFFMGARTVEPKFGSHKQYGLITTPATYVDPGAWPHIILRKHQERKRRQRQATSRIGGDL